MDFNQVRHPSSEEIDQLVSLIREPYYPCTQLNNDEQLLDIFNRTPSQDEGGEFYLIYCGRDSSSLVMNENLYPGVKRNCLVFPAEILDFYSTLQVEIDGKICFVWGKNTTVDQSYYLTVTFPGGNISGPTRLLGVHSLKEAKKVLRQQQKLQPNCTFEIELRN